MRAKHSETTASEDLGKISWEKAEWVSLVPERWR